MTQVRISKYLAECGECSRRSAEALITEGKVRVNGFQVKDLSTQVTPGKDHVQIGNRTVRAAEKGILLLHKPRGVVCTLSDPHGRKCIADYITKQYSSYFPVGRLDYDSSGLLVLTNDGDLANRLMHPRFGFEREYEVRVRGAVAEKTVRRLLHGMKLDDGFVKALKVRIEETKDNETTLLISVGEGKNRMVRRMMDSVGHPVVRLKRLRHGPLGLGSLVGGEIRKLTEKEYQILRAKLFSEESGKPKRPTIDRINDRTKIAKVLRKGPVKHKQKRRVRD